MSDALDLFAREGWPGELKVLINAHPRETWDTHPNLGQMASFWLQRHGMFREIGGALSDATRKLSAGEIGAEGFVNWFMPRASFFLQELHTHHNVEDHHYFPVFRAADARLTRGFEVLDRDHHTLDGLIHRFADDANAFIGALSDDPRAAGDTLTKTANHTLDGLLRHLSDEEDLIIPLILERSEEGLGVG